MLTCARCKQRLQRKHFSDHPTTKSGKQSYCKPCAREFTKSRAPQRRETHLRNKYGLTPADYDDMLAHQQGVCAICGIKPGDPDGEKQNDKFLSIDHCHTTGQVRGLLCVHCNKGIGHLRGSTERLEAAVEYLNNPPRLQADR